MEHTIGLTSKITKIWSIDHLIRVAYDDPCMIVKGLEHSIGLTNQTYEGHMRWSQGDSEKD